jgi:hypothetical protein
MLLLAFSKLVLSAFFIASRVVAALSLFRQLAGVKGILSP